MTHKKAHGQENTDRGYRLPEAIGAYEGVKAMVDLMEPGQTCSTV